LRKEFRFITNCGKDDIGGLPIRRDCDTIVITKSYKDYRVLTNIGLTVIWLQSETLIPKEQLNKILENKSKVVIIFDNDRVGIEASLKLKDFIDYHLDRYKIIDNSTYKEAIKEAVIKAQMGEKALYNYNPNVEKKKKFICDFGIWCRHQKHALRILPQQQVKVEPKVKELVLTNIKKRIENELYKRKIAENILHQYGQSYR